MDLANAPQTIGYGFYSHKTGKTVVAHGKNVFTSSVLEKIKSKKMPDSWHHPITFYGLIDMNGETTRYCVFDFDASKHNLEDRYFWRKFAQDANLTALWHTEFEKGVEQYKLFDGEAMLEAVKKWDE